MRITSIKAVPISYRVPRGPERPARHRPRRQARRGAGEGHHRRRPDRMGRGPSRPLPGRDRETDRHHDLRTRRRHGCDERRRRLAARLPDAAGEPRHGLCRRDGAERPRSRAVGYPRQGGRLAAVQIARRRLKADQGLCRRHLARLAAAGNRWRRKRSATSRKGYRAIKLRVGDNPRDDVARATAVREAVGDVIEILVDANTGYTVDDVRRVMPAYDELADRLARRAVPGAGLSLLPDRRIARHHAAGGRRKPLHPLRVHPPDRGRRREFRAAGSVQDRRRHRNDADRRAWPLPGSCRSIRTPRRPASTWPRPSTCWRPSMCPDISKAMSPGHNPFRDEVGGVPYTLDADGCVKPSETPGLGVEIDEAFINAHPLIEGPCYV